MSAAPGTGEKIRATRGNIGWAAPRLDASDASPSAGVLIASRLAGPASGLSAGGLAGLAGGLCAGGLAGPAGTCTACVACAASSASSIREASRASRWKADRCRRSSLRAQPNVEVELVDRLRACRRDILDVCVAPDGDLGRLMAREWRFVGRYRLRVQYAGHQKFGVIVQLRCQVEALVSGPVASTAVTGLPALRWAFCQWRMTNSLARVRISS